MDIFDKESLTAEEQIDLLIKRGLNVTDKTSAIDIIKRIGYYHLSSYMRNFQKDEQHNFRENVEFSDIYNLYKFDQELRHITFNAIEKIEIAYRTAISNVMCKKYGSHWFNNTEAFITSRFDKKNNKNIDYIEETRSIILKEIKKKDNDYAETFIANYYKKYSTPDVPPFWMVAETLTIGALNKIYQKINWEYKKEIVKYLGFDEDIKIISKSNWLFALSVVRNICAHHSRLFNRVFRIAPTTPEKVIELKYNTNRDYYHIAMVINYYLSTMSFDVSFEHNLQTLLKRYPQIDKTKMGFPKDWTNFTITRVVKARVAKS